MISLHARAWQQAGSKTRESRAADQASFAKKSDGRKQFKTDTSKATAAAVWFLASYSQDKRRNTLKAAVDILHDVNSKI